MQGKTALPILYCDIYGNSISTKYDELDHPDD